MVVEEGGYLGRKASSELGTARYLDYLRLPGISSMLYVEQIAFCWLFLLLLLFIPDPRSEIRDVMFVGLGYSDGQTPILF